MEAYGRAGPPPRPFRLDSDTDSETSHQRLPTAVSVILPPFTPSSVQVVDRLRWWRVQRIREQPLPLQHYVLGGNYVNFSAFGTRPLSRRLTRLLSAPTVSVAPSNAKLFAAQNKDSTTSATPILHSELVTAGGGGREGAVGAGAVVVVLGGQEDDAPLLLEVGSAQQRGRRHRTHDGPHRETESAAPAGAAVEESEENDAHRNEAVMAGDGGVRRGERKEKDKDHRHHHHHKHTRGQVHSLHRHRRSQQTSPRPPLPPSLQTCQALSTTDDGEKPRPVDPVQRAAEAAQRLRMLFRPRGQSAPQLRRTLPKTTGAAASSAAEELRRGRRITPGVSQTSHMSSNSFLFSSSLPLAQLGVMQSSLRRGSTSPVEDTERQAISRAGDELAQENLTHAPRAVVLHHPPRLVVYSRTMLADRAVESACVTARDLESNAVLREKAEVLALSSLPMFSFERFFYGEQLRDPSVDDDGRVRTLPLPATPMLNHPGHLPVPTERPTAYGASPTTIRGAAVPSLSSPPLRSVREGAVTVSNTQRRRGHRLRAASVPALPFTWSQLRLHPRRRDRRSAARPSGGDSNTRRAQKGAITSPGQGQIDNENSFASYGGGASNGSKHTCRKVDDLQDVYVFNPLVDGIGTGAFSQVYAAVPILRGPSLLRDFEADSAAHARGPTVRPPTLSSAAMAVGGGADRRSSTPLATTPVTQSLSQTQSPQLSSLVPPTPTTTTAAAAAAVTAVPKRTNSPIIVALKVIPRKAKRRTGSLSAPHRATGASGANPGNSLTAGSPAALAATAATGRELVPPSSSPSRPSDASNDDNDAAVVGGGGGGLGPAENSQRRELVEIEREISILRRLRHTGCSRFFEAVRSPDTFAIAMKKHKGSMDARQFLYHFGPPSEARAALLLYQLVSTVHYLHYEFGLIHRDIKLENVLVSLVDNTLEQIHEVLGTAVHKADKNTVQGTGGSHGAASPSSLGAEGQQPPAVSPSALNRYGTFATTATETPSQLLRVTLIDFGLARRTKMSSNRRAAHASTSGGLTPFAGGSSNTLHHHHHHHATSSFSGSANASLTTVPPVNAAGTLGRREGMLRSASHLLHGGGGGGMPTPMPSTANMLVAYLDYEDDDEEEDSAASSTDRSASETSSSSSSSASSSAITSRCSSKSGGSRSCCSCGSDMNGEYCSGEANPNAASGEGEGATKTHGREAGDTPLAQPRSASSSSSSSSSHSPRCECEGNGEAGRSGQAAAAASMDANDGDDEAEGGQEGEGAERNTTRGGGTSFSSPRLSTPQPAAANENTSCWLTKVSQSEAAPRSDDNDETEVTPLLLEQMEEDGVPLERNKTPAARASESMAGGHSAPEPPLPLPSSSSSAAPFPRHESTTMRHSASQGTLPPPPPPAAGSSSSHTMTFSTSHAGRPGAALKTDHPSTEPLVAFAAAAAGGSRESAVSAGGVPASRSGFAVTTTTTMAATGAAAAVHRVTFPARNLSSMALAGSSLATDEQGWAGVHGLPSLSRRPSRANPSNSLTEVEEEDETTQLLLTPCGTEKYLPPEMLEWIVNHTWGTRRPTTVALARKLDVYAIGVVAYVLLSGCFPFNATTRVTLAQQERRGPRCNSAKWNGVSPEAISFVQGMLEPDPNKRLTTRQALQHPFMRSAAVYAEKLDLVPHAYGETSVTLTGLVPPPPPPPLRGAGPTLHTPHSSELRYRATFASSSIPIAQQQQQQQQQSPLSHSRRPLSGSYSGPCGRPMGRSLLAAAQNPRSGTASNEATPSRHDLLSTPNTVSFMDPVSEPGCGAAAGGHGASQRGGQTPTGNKQPPPPTAAAAATSFVTPSLSGNAASGSFNGTETGPAGSVQAATMATRPSNAGVTATQSSSTSSSFYAQAVRQCLGDSPDPSAVSASPLVASAARGEQAEGTAGGGSVCGGGGSSPSASSTTTAGTLLHPCSPTASGGAACAVLGAFHQLPQPSSTVTPTVGTSALPPGTATGGALPATAMTNAGAPTPLSPPASFSSSSSVATPAAAGGGGGPAGGRQQLPRPDSMPFLPQIATPVPVLPTTASTSSLSSSLNPSLPASRPPVPLQVPPTLTPPVTLAPSTLSPLPKRAEMAKTMTAAKPLSSLPSQKEEEKEAVASPAPWSSTATMPVSAPSVSTGEDASGVVPVPPSSSAAGVVVPSVVGAKRSPPAAPAAKTAAAARSGGDGGGRRSGEEDDDDLFDQLYNDIMTSD